MDVRVYWILSKLVLSIANVIFSNNEQESPFLGTKGNIIPALYICK